MATFTHTKLMDIDDSALSFGMGEFQEARFANAALECEQTGLAFHRLKPGKRSPIAHRHAKQEELYVVLSGSGRAKLGDAFVDLAPLEALRVAPDVVRGFEAGADGLEFLAFGAPAVDGDEPDTGELVDDHWDD